MRAPIRVLMALPGLHRESRGAEVAFEAVATRLACMPGFRVTMLGGGPPRLRTPYSYHQVPLVSRTRFVGWPKFPPLRSEYRWEELTFAPGCQWRAFLERKEVTLTCSYPFVSWMLRLTGGRHLFVTQNGDWPAQRAGAEYRLFDCDGLVCTNPEYFERHRQRWRSVLIPNGIDVSRFQPGPGLRESLGIAESAKVIVMVSALIASKQVEAGIRAVAALEGEPWLLLAGDGPLRASIDHLGAELLGRRYRRLSLKPDAMPAFYRTGDLFLHLSREEAFGNVYVEAAACGIPVAAHDYPTARWILGEWGHFADTRDPEATVMWLRERLQAPPLDRDRQHAAMASRFAWDHVAAQYADFIREVA